MAARKIKNSWWVDFCFSGVRFRKRSPENSRAGAQAHEIVLRQRLARGENILAKSQSVEQAPRFEEFAWKWFDDYVVTNNKHSEQRTKKYVLTGTLVPFFGKLLITEITSHRIEQFKAQRAKDGIA